jgi:hypothetical protein
MSGIWLSHTTTADRADTILRAGCRESLKLRGKVFYLTAPYARMAEVPPPDEDLFCGTGLFHLDADQRHLVAHDLPADIRRTDARCLARSR